MYFLYYFIPSKACVQGFATCVSKKVLSSEENNALSKDVMKFIQSCGKSKTRFKRGGDTLS